MADDRALANLRADITAANRNLARWRMDGNCDRIGFWCRRVNELLDQYPRAAQPLETAQ